MKHLAWRIFELSLKKQTDETKLKIITLCRELMRHCWVQPKR